jgi:hypothetical protein
MSNNEPTFSLKTVKAMIKQFTGVEQVIGVPRPFIRMTGDHVSAMVLNQILYLSDSFDSEDGWFYRSREQWEQDICVTPYQLDRAVKHLAQFGVEKAVKKYNGAPTLHFRIDWQKFIALFTKFLENQETKQSSPISKKLDNQETSLSNTPPTAHKTPIVKKVDNQETLVSIVEKLDHPLKDQKIHLEEIPEEKEVDISARVENVFLDYCKTIKEVRRTERRLSLIKVRLLEGYAEADLHAVWLGCLRDPWPERKLHNDITNLLETPERIERMIEFSTIELPQRNGNHASAQKQSAPNRRQDQKQSSPVGVVSERTAYDPFDGKHVV